MLTQAGNARNSQNAMKSGNLLSILRPARLLGTASTLALTVAVGVAFNAVTPTPAYAGKCEMFANTDPNATEQWR